MTALRAQPGAGGLSEAEATRRIAARGPLQGPASSRSYASIVRANVLTIFNAILAAFGVLTLAFGDWRDALFLAVLLANTTIGITQEVRAKRTLDRLALLVAPRATVVRDGVRRDVAPDQLVVGDLVAVEAGDQILADGPVVAAHDLRLDEAILSGESEPVRRAAGEELRSGAYVVEGAGTFEVSAVGAESWAQRLVGDARSFRHPRSPLEQAINRMLLVLVGLVVGLGTLLGYALWHSHVSIGDAVATATAGVVSLVPEGLVVLVSLTYAVSGLRMARRGVLSQQLNAIESLASADVICLDKTGTLTDAALHVVEAIPAEGFEAARLERMLARVAASASLRNGTLEALAERFPAQAEATVAEVPFASRRRWSGVQLAETTLLLGAPERFGLDGSLSAAAERERTRGRRVLAIAESAAPLSDGDGDGDRSRDGLPAGAEVAGLVVLAERLRPDTRATVAFFAEQGIELKVLSGDNPETAAAIAADAGIPVTAAAVAGDALPEDPEALRELVARTTVFGRVAPEDKRRIVESLRDAGRYVAMVGDGVNDVPALKAARLAIAQGSGAQIAKGVADLVLVRGDFAAIPALVAEGRQTLRNLQRVARLYATKSAFAAFLILTIGLTSTAYPLLPRHFSLAAALTIGIPTFFLALAPSSGGWRPEAFGRRVARFAVPAGTIVGAGVVSSYLFCLRDLDYGVTASRTVATTVLIAAGLYLVVSLEAQTPARRRAVTAMCAALAGCYVAVLLIPSLRHFFELVVPSAGMLATAFVGAAISIGSLALAGFSVAAPAPPRPPAGDR